MKTCKHPDCGLPLFSGGYCKLAWHQTLRTDEKYLKAQAKRKEKARQPRQPIRKESKKQGAANRKYSRELPGWKEENSICVYPGCECEAVDCHHSGGRGILINNKKFMIPLCRLHHDMCKMEPKRARELKLIFSRLLSLKYVDLN